MAVLGITVKPSARPSINCVVLDGTRENPECVDAFDLKANDDGFIDQIDHLGKALASKLTGMQVDKVVIRTADFAVVASRRAATSQRLLLEGAVAFVCRSKIKDVSLRSGRDVGEQLGVSKDKAETRGRDLDSRRREAAAAALSALPMGAE